MSNEEYHRIIEKFKDENKELIESGKYKKMFTENLPKWNNGCYIGKINWEKSIGYKVFFIYDNLIGWINIIKYIKGKQPKVKILYKSKEAMLLTSCFSNCIIGEILGKKTKDFKIEIGTHYKDSQRDITITDMKREQNENGKWSKLYKYTCNVCGFDCGEHYYPRDKKYKDELWIGESNLLKHKQGCSCCHSVIVVNGINDVITTDPWMIPYIGKECAKTHTHGSNDKVQVTCTDCGRIRDKKIEINKIYTYKSIGCSCSDSVSYPNKIAYSLLEQLNQIYKFDYLEHEYSPEWIGLKRYDNYFIYQKKQYILEMDGKWHSKDNKMSGQTKYKSKAIDDYKDEQARLHGIEVIRIDCTISDLNFIKQNVLSNNNINNLFDLRKIDWQKCEDFALSNLVKVVCEYKRNNSNITAFKIAKIMKLSQGTIRTYLKKGRELYWCDYDAKEEQRKSIEKYRLDKSKEVKIFKDGVYLGKFISCSDLARKSEKLFGVKLKGGGIIRVCNGKAIHYKGYKFEYANITDKEHIIIEQNKSILKTKHVICLNNRIITYNVTQCAKNSLQLFGIKISYSSIYNICNNKQKEIKGFMFKYIQDLTEEDYITYDITNKLKELKAI